MLSNAPVPVEVSPLAMMMGKAIMFLLMESVLIVALFAFLLLVIALGGITKIPYVLQ